VLLAFPDDPTASGQTQSTVGI